MLSLYYPLMTSFISQTVTTKPVVKDFKYYGDIAPTGFFDPLKLSSEKNSKYLREFELQHGRVAMVASTLIPLYELMRPDELGINYLSSMDFGQQLPFWYVMALLEFGRMKSGWQNPFTNGTLFSLKDDFQPGNHLNFDVNKVSDRAYNSELSNGRLAMLATAHMIASELVTGHGLF